METVLLPPYLRVTLGQFQKCVGDVSSSPCSAMVEEHQAVVGSCLLLMGTTPACRYSPPDGPSVVMPEHKSCPPPVPVLRPANANVANTAGAGKVDIW